MDAKLIADNVKHEVDASEDEVSPAATACVAGVELLIRKWWGYQALITNRPFNEGYVEWCLQAALLRKKIDDHIAKQCADLGQRAPSRKQILHALGAASERQMEYAVMLADDILSQ